MRVAASQRQGCCQRRCAGGYLNLNAERLVFSPEVLIVAENALGDGQHGLADFVADDELLPRALREITAMYDYLE